ncbi:outer membrane beta-barrel protein [Flavobacterium rakeshii]|uniref:Outer membrane beta-barrel protein n=1 Tax=Flavobacterium rakeshii TaxID=1038845 RepID=A0A6N8HCE2_9FLAO|nr:porin family protein [Flavobacterium rakeshii]MUV03215.1 outer membrane beta-barrel protein [Flavobacterium rakeshii]
MKKILLSATALLAFGFASQAQDIKFGAKAGLNIADFGGDAETSGSRTGFHVGVVAEFKLTEQFSIQPEIVYSMQGAKFETLDGFASIVEQDMKLDYLNVPIMAKYYLFEGFSIQAGPQVGFLMSAKVDDDDAKDSFKSIDFALNGGVGYELPSGVFFQARYSAGLADINDVEGFEGADAPKINNNVISFSVGYKF